mmetsp:Transcript_20045/g.37704  ORF Transcript_20045/g.37704 Transcript_20045/m.37704 type:complete len:261 (+) Transcript_20045:426-1208(+)
MEGLHAAVKVLVHVGRHLLKLPAVQPPPHLEAQGFGAHAPPVKDAQVELSFLVAPEVGIIHVQVVVGERYVVSVRMAPVLQLCHVCIQLHHGGPKLLLPSIRAAKAWEKHLSRVCHEIEPRVQLCLQLVGWLPAATRLHAKCFLWPRSNVFEVSTNHLLVSELPGFGKASHARSAPHQGHVVFRRRSAQGPIHALVVWSLDLVRLQLLLWGAARRAFEVQSFWVLESDALRDEDEVRGLVANVAKVIPGDLHRQLCFQEP